jgi:hypothetical protein
LPNELIDEIVQLSIALPFDIRVGIDNELDNKLMRDQGRQYLYRPVNPDEVFLSDSDSEEEAEEQKSLGLDLSAIGLVLGLEVAERTNHWFLTDNTFVLYSFDSAIEWLKHIGPKNRSILTSLRVEVYTDYHRNADWFRLLGDCSQLKKVEFRRIRGLSLDTVWMMLKTLVIFESKRLKITQSFV